jgi:hypothetical protein
MRSAARSNSTFWRDARVFSRWQRSVAQLEYFRCELAAPLRSARCTGYRRRPVLAVSRDEGRMTTRIHLPKVPVPYRGAMLLVASFSVLASCSRKIERAAPPTFPVKGRVVTSGDRLPVGGCVEFEPNQNGLEITACGVIGSEGQFSLSIPFVDRVLPGATEGSHSVRILLPIDDGGGVVRIREAFIVQPRENEFTINIPKRH